MSQSLTTSQRRRGPTNTDSDQHKSAASSGPNGRLPKPLSFLLGPLKRFSANYQLIRAQEYHDEGGEYVEDIGNNYPEWRRRQEYAELVEDGREVLSYMEDMLDRDSWSASESRDIKHVARMYRTSALRSSRIAKQEMLEEGVTYTPDDATTPPQSASSASSLHPPSHALGLNRRADWVESGPFNMTTPSDGTLLMQSLQATEQA